MDVQTFPTAKWVLLLIIPAGRDGPRSTKIPRRLQTDWHTKDTLSGDALGLDAGRVILRAQRMFLVWIFDSGRDG